MRKFILWLVLMLVVSIVAPVCTKVAQPAYPLWFNPAPSSEQIHMRMNIREETSVDERGVAELSALFTMENLGGAAECMPVRFPAGIRDGWIGVSNFEDIFVKVDEFPYFRNSLQKMNIVLRVIIMVKHPQEKSIISD